MKKQVLFLFALALALTACNQNKDQFKVNVSLTNGNDRTVYLQKYVDNAPVTIGVLPRQPVGYRARDYPIPALPAKTADTLSADAIGLRATLSLHTKYLVAMAD